MEFFNLIGTGIEELAYKRSNKKLGDCLIREPIKHLTAILLVLRSKKFTKDLAAESESWNANSFLRLYKQKMMFKFMEIQTIESKLTQERLQKSSVFLIPHLKGTEMIITWIVLVSQINTKTKVLPNHSKKIQQATNFKKNFLKVGSLVEARGEKSNCFTVSREDVDNI